MTSLVRIMLLPIALLLSLGCWALASPPGSSPDEDYHLTSIWCGLGEREGLCEAGDSANERRIPAPLLESARCFVFQPEQSASCPLPDMSDLVNTHRGNFEGGYPPLFYATLGVFASSDLNASVIVMRSVNALIFVGLTAVLFTLIPAGRRAPLLWGTAITSIPLGIFLIPSLNPSSWALISAVTLWVAYAEFLREKRTGRRIAFASVALVATVLGSGARADSAIYSVIAVGVASLLFVERTRRFWISSLLGVGIAVIAAVFFFGAGQSAVIDPQTQVREASLAMLIFGNLVLLPELWAGIFGTWNWGLGWLDTMMPGTVWVTSIFVFSAAIFWGLRRTTVRKGVAVGAVFAALIAIPMYIYIHDGVMVGAYVQPRYVLPLIVILAGVAISELRRDDLGMTKLQLGIMAVGLSLANGIALHTNIRRYVTGAEVRDINLDAGAEWWWPLSFGPMWIWLIGSLTFGAFIVGAVRVSRQAPNDMGDIDQSTFTDVQSRRTAN